MMEKISIVKRRLEVSPTRAELRARQRMESRSPEALTGGTAMAALGPGNDTPPDQGASRPVTVDLSSGVIDELWSADPIAETSTGARHFIVEAEKDKEGAHVVLKLQFMKPDYYLRLLTAEEVCEMLHISRSTLYLYAHSKELKSYRMGRSLRFRFQDVLEFLSGCEADRD